MPWGFFGGIHPPTRKEATRGFAFVNLPVPHTCWIPLQQHIGAAAKPVVAVGDSVAEGQVIGAAEGFISANVHASIPGKVVGIHEVITASGVRPAVVIEAEGSFSTTTVTPEPAEWQSLSIEEIRDRIKSAGIVGMGGAAFPTAVKLSPPAGRKIDTIVVNGAECEPYLTVDDMLMQTYPNEIIEGARIARKVVGAQRILIGVEANKPAALAALQAAVAAWLPEPIQVVKLPTRYPQGAERQMIYTLLKREVPSGGLPMDAGVIVQNVGTLHAIREAVLFERPLIARYLTVGGGAIAKPGNYKARIGMRLRDIVEECGGFRDRCAAVVIGGPMCGMAVPSLDVPVVKGTSGVLFLTEGEIAKGEYGPCIRCGKCVAACPMGLLPCDIANATERQRDDLAAALHPFDCILCGSCSYVCPSKRPVSAFITQVRARLSAAAKKAG